MLHSSLVELLCRGQCRRMKGCDADVQESARSDGRLWNGSENSSRDLESLYIQDHAHIITIESC